MTIIVIDGWWGSGKSTLKGLLDGHPSLQVSPVQDSLIGGLALDETKSSWMKYRDIEFYRHFLASKTNYYRIEKFADCGSVIFQPNATTSHYLDFHFDFIGFDKAIKDTLYHMDQWSSHDIIESFYSNFFRFWTDYPTRECDQMWVTMEANKDNTPDFLLSQDIDFKYIYVDRATEGTISTRYKRTPIPGFSATDKYSQSTLEQFIESGEVLRICRKRKSMIKLASLYPANFAVFRLEDIVTNTDKISIDLAEFLKISHIPLLSEFTYCGKKFAGSNEYLGRLNDDYEQIFSKMEITLLRQEMARAEEPSKAIRSRPRLCNHLKNYWKRIHN